MTTPSDAGRDEERPPDGDSPWPAWSLPPPGSAGRVGSSGAPTNGLAIGSLIASIVGLVTTCLCGIGVIGAIIGVVMGPMARNQIRQSGGQQSGDGLALGGIIVGWVAIGLTALWIAFFLLGMLGSLIPLGGW